MSLNLPIARKDLLLLRPAMLTFAVCLTVVIVSYFGSSYVNQKAIRDAANARNLYDQANQSVQEIAQEEATIVIYIDRYRAMVQDGIVSDEDRLSILETIGAIRQRYDLFPVGVTMGEQRAVALEYDPNELISGDPVALRSTDIEIRMSLLHEQDITRLLGALIESDGLIIPIDCDMRVNNYLQVDFTTLGEHMTASCQLQLYTFDLNPPVAAVEY